MGQSNDRQVAAFCDSLHPTVEALLKASRYAADTDSSVWDFAIPIRQLLKLGATQTDLRWMVRKGFIEHGREVTIEGEDGRAFRSTGNLTFTQRTCFVFTELGIQSAELSVAATNGYHINPANNNGHSILIPPKQCSDPVWDMNLRKLSLDDVLVKRFKWPAVNQEAVLCAFQEEGWPERIDDPLPPQPEQDPKRRLADTIKCLNRRQVNELVHFRGDGTGEGVVWERNDTNGNATDT